MEWPLRFVRDVLMCKDVWLGERAGSASPSRAVGVLSDGLEGVTQVVPR